MFIFSLSKKESKPGNVLLCLCKFFLLVIQFTCLLLNLGSIIIYNKCLSEQLEALLHHLIVCTFWYVMIKTWNIWCRFAKLLTCRYWAAIRWICFMLSWTILNFEFLVLLIIYEFFKSLLTFAHIVIWCVAYTIKFALCTFLASDESRLTFRISREEIAMWIGPLKMCLL